MIYLNQFKNKFFTMKKIMTGLLAVMLLSSVAVHAEKTKKVPKQKSAKTECTKSKCPDKADCSKPVCPSKPGCVCK
jgi:hypothetical protein